MKIKNEFSRCGPVRIALAFSLFLLCAGAAFAQDRGEDDNSGRGGISASELRRFIDEQVGGIAKLKVPAKDADIPLP